MRQSLCRFLFCVLDAGDFPRYRLDLRRFLCRLCFLPIEFYSTGRAVIQGIYSFGFKGFALAFTGRLQGFAYGAFAGFDLFVAFTVFDSASSQLFLPLDFLYEQIRFGQFKAPDEFQMNLSLLRKSPSNFSGAWTRIFNKSLIIGVVRSEKSVFQ